MSAYVHASQSSVNAPPRVVDEFPEAPHNFSMVDNRGLACSDDACGPAVVHRTGTFRPLRASAGTAATDGPGLRVPIVAMCSKRSAQRPFTISTSANERPNPRRRATRSVSRALIEVTAVRPRMAGGARVTPSSVSSRRSEKRATTRANKWISGAFDSNDVDLKAPHSLSCDARQEIGFLWSAASCPTYRLDVTIKSAWRRCMICIDVLRPRRRTSFGRAS